MGIEEPWNNCMSNWTPLIEEHFDPRGVLISKTIQHTPDGVKIPMNEENRELDLALAECEQENRLLRARNERLMNEVQMLSEAMNVMSKRIDELENQHGT